MGISKIQEIRRQFGHFRLFLEILEFRRIDTGYLLLLTRRRFLLRCSRLLLETKYEVKQQKYRRGPTDLELLQMRLFILRLPKFARSRFKL